MRNANPTTLTLLAFITLTSVAAHVGATEPGGIWAKAPDTPRTAPWPPSMLLGQGNSPRGFRIRFLGAEFSGDTTDAERLAAHFSNREFDYVRLEGGAEGSREILLAKPDVFFMRDTLGTGSKRFQLLALHPGKGGTVSVGKDGASGIARNGKAALHTWSANGARITQTTGALRIEATHAPAAARVLIALAPDINDALPPGTDSQNAEGIVPNRGFENGMEGWRPRSKPGFRENHAIDTAVSHGGKASARIDAPGGYYYSQYFQAPVGSEVQVVFHARAPLGGARTGVFFWKDGKAFKRVHGPDPKGTEWKRYIMSAVVPEGAEQVSLTFEYWADEGSAWYDDIEVAIGARRSAGPGTPEIAEPEVTMIDNGASGMVCRRGDRTHVFLTGKAGARTIQAAGHTFTTDAELAVVSLTPRGRAAFLLRGEDTIRIDGRAYGRVRGVWHGK